MEKTGHGAAMKKEERKEKKEEKKTYEKPALTGHQKLTNVIGEFSAS